MTNLHITIGTTPNSGGTGMPLLNVDLALLKVGLLYGDQAKLCSLAGSMIAILTQASLLDEAQRLDAMESWVTIAARGDPGASRAFDLLRELRRKRRRSGAELIALRKLEAQIDAAWESIQSTIEGIASVAGLDGIVEALQTGLVELEIYPTETAAAVEAFFRSVSHAVLSPTTYPLFDDQTGSLVSSAVREGIIAMQTADALKSRVSGLASDLLQRLPLFETASIGETLAIRGELDPSLRRFRATMVEYSRAIESAAWDASFQTEAELLFRQYVEPAILEIEEQVRSGSFFKAVLRQIRGGASVVPPTTSGLGVLVSKAGDFSDLLGASAGFAVGAGLLAKAVADDRAAERANIERNKLYFYYKARSSFGG